VEVVAVRVQLICCHVTNDSLDFVYIHHLLY
jgi:hypothetical protein